jgi:hypothetical protein
MSIILHCKSVYVYLWFIPHPTAFTTQLWIHGMYVCMYVCMCIYIYVCMYVYIYVSMYDHGVGGRILKWISQAKCCESVEQMEVAQDTVHW